MPKVNHNPGDLVWDQRTGEPYINEDGEMVRVEPGTTYTLPDGRVIDGDDVANAAFYRANKFEGETLRDRSVGVPYERLVLGQGNAEQAMVAVISEIRSQTPGVVGVVSVRVTAYSSTDRLFRFTATLLREDGEETTTGIQVAGG